jgi:hypothetical protein
MWISLDGHFGLIFGYLLKAHAVSNRKFLANMLVCLGLTTSPAMAQDSSADEKIKVTLQPYVWVPTLKGSATLGAIGAPVRVVPKDFIEGLQIGGMGGVKVEKSGKYLYAQTIIFDYDNKSFRPFFRQPLKAKVRYLNVGVGMTKSIHLDDLLVVTLAPQVGVQYLYLMADVDGSLIVAKAKGRWWSPSAGMTASMPVTKRLYVAVSGDAAGFGLGSTNYKNASANLNYQLGRHWTASAGYRIAKGRYDEPGGLSINIKGKGPMVALAYNFSVSK